MGGLHKVNHPFLKFHLLVGHVHYTKGKGRLSIRKEVGTRFLGLEMRVGGIRVPVISSQRPGYLVRYLN